MEPLEQANALLAELAKELNSETQELDPEYLMGNVTIGDTMLIFTFDDDTDELFSSAYIVPTPEGPDKEEKLLELMRANYAWNGTDGGILGLDGDIGFVTHSLVFYMPMTKAEDFLTAISRQLQLADHWRGALTQSGGPQNISAA
jgi:hypothetical protein